MLTNKSKWTLFTVISIAAIVLAIIFSNENVTINETRTIQPPPSLSFPSNSSISGTVKFDSISTNSFNLEYPSKVHIDFSAGHYGVGATITDNIGSHVLDLSFNNLVGANNPSGEFTGNPGAYNITISGPSSFAPSDPGKSVSYGLTLTTYKIITFSPTAEIVPIVKQIRNWTKFCFILVPVLIILILTLRIKPKPRPPVIPSMYDESQFEIYGQESTRNPPSKDDEINVIYEPNDPLHGSKLEDFNQKLKSKLNHDKASHLHKEVNKLYNNGDINLDQTFKIDDRIEKGKKSQESLDNIEDRLRNIKKNPNK